jgi:hypothetical protein
VTNIIQTVTHTGVGILCPHVMLFDFMHYNSKNVFNSYVKKTFWFESHTELYISYRRGLMIELFGPHSLCLNSMPWRRVGGGEVKLHTLSTSWKLEVRDDSMNRNTRGCVAVEKFGKWSPAVQFATHHLVTYSWWTVLQSAFSCVEKWGRKPPLQRNVGDSKRLDEFRSNLVGAH